MTRLNTAGFSLQPYQVANKAEADVEARGNRPLGPFAALVSLVNLGSDIEGVRLHVLDVLDARETILVCTNS